MSRPDRCTDKIVKQTHMRNSNGCPSLPNAAMPKPDKQRTRYHPVLVYCWRSVADDGSILNRHWIKTSRVCSIEGVRFRRLRDYLLQNPIIARVIYVHVSKSTVQSIL